MPRKKDVAGLGLVQKTKRFQRVQKRLLKPEHTTEDQESRKSRMALVSVGHGRVVWR